MAAEYPANIKTFNTKDPGDPIQSAHINDLQNEVVAVETQLGVNAGTWQNWTPTVTFEGGTVDPPTITKYHARYTTIGKIAIASADYLFANGGDRTQYKFTLPLTPAQTYVAATGYESLKTAFTDPTKASLSASGAIVTVYVPVQDKAGHVMFTAIYEVA